jgi:pyruvate formate-lyase activating enzyme-like uncharacterized protein
MYNIEYNNTNDSWYSKVSVKDTVCYFDEDGKIHRLDGPALYPENQWLYKNINVTYSFEQFVNENNLEMNEENFKIFLFEWKIKKNLTY